MNLSDMIGKTFGKWYVFERGDYGKNNCLYWWCRCACGRTEKQVSGTNLRSGQSKQCRKCSNEESYAKRFSEGGSLKLGYRFAREDLVDKQFNGLIVRERAENIGGHPAWLAECIYCGTKKAYREQALTSLKQKSCGCMQRELQIEAHTTHGKSRSRVYGIWRGMIKRCTNPKHNGFENYGGRGIKVCERWRIFSNFYSDMGDPPTEYHTLERLNNDGNYDPKNCEWSTRSRSARNRRVTTRLNVEGKSVALEDIADAVGVSSKVLRYHLAKGRTIAQAVAIFKADPQANI